MYAVNRTRGTYLGVNLAVAKTFHARLLGLLPRRHLRWGDGVWLVPCSSVHTFGLRYPIDLIFLDQQGRVVRVCERVSPGRVIWPIPRAHSALELPAGVIASSETTVGDYIELTTISFPPEVGQEPAVVRQGTDGTVPGVEGASSVREGHRKR